MLFSPGTGPHKTAQYEGRTWMQVQPKGHFLASRSNIAKSYSPNSAQYIGVKAMTMISRALGTTPNLRTSSGL